MKYERPLMVSLGCSLIVGFWLVLNFKTTHETYFMKLMAEKNLLQSQNKTLKDDLTFLKTHAKELDFLAKKGWFFPTSRLIAREVIEKRCGTLKGIQYTFEPETFKSTDENHTFKVTKIIMEVKSPLDTDIYEFIRLMLEEFPGILRARTITLEKDKNSYFIVGNLVFEWVAMGPKANES